MAAFQQPVDMAFEGGCCTSDRAAETPQRRSFEAWVYSVGSWFRDLVSQGQDKGDLDTIEYFENNMTPDRRQREPRTKGCETGDRRCRRLALALEAAVVVAQRGGGRVEVVVVAGSSSRSRSRSSSSSSSSNMSSSSIMSSRSSKTRKSSGRTTGQHQGNC